MFKPVNKSKRNSERAASKRKFSTENIIKKIMSEWYLDHLLCSTRTNESSHSK